MRVRELPTPKAGVRLEAVFGDLPVSPSNCGWGVRCDAVLTLVGPEVILSTRYLRANSTSFFLQSFSMSRDHKNKEVGGGVSGGMDSVGRRRNRVFRWTHSTSRHASLAVVELKAAWLLVSMSDFSSHTHDIVSFVAYQGKTVIVHTPFAYSGHKS